MDAQGSFIKCAVLALRIAEDNEAQKFPLYQVSSDDKGHHTGPLQERGAEGAAYFQQALMAARRDGAKSLELRAAVSLARLWRKQEKQVGASQLLAEVYGWFTEGFETADLQDATASLKTLA